MGKLTIPSFYGSSKMSSSAWLQKLSVYFQLDPMVEEDALKMAILHLEGESSDWWFHGIRTLGHYHIFYYEGFSNAMMERFMRKDPELPFKLKQVGTLEAYMLEFEKISVMVYDICMARLVLIFIEVLTEPFRGLMKSHKPATLKDSMNLTRDLQNILPRTKYTPKPNFPSKFNEGKKPWKNDSSTK